MKNIYQHPGFTFETNIAKYNIDYSDWEEGKEKWIVDIEYKSSEKIIGHFELPIEWSRVLVFKWLSALEINEIGKD